MTTAIKLVLAQAFVSSATSLVHQLMRNRVLHRRPFAERGPSTLRLHLGSQLLLELLVLADAQASALSVGSLVARKAHASHATAGNWTCLPGTIGTVWPPGQVTRIPASQGKIMLREKRTNGLGASDNVHALLRPLGNAWARHVSQVDIRLAAGQGLSQLLGQQLYCLMLRLIRRADHHLPG